MLNGMYLSRPCGRSWKECPGESYFLGHGLAVNLLSWSEKIEHLAWVELWMPGISPRILFLAYPLTSLAWWYFRRRRRIRRAKLGLCAQCGYDLRGAASGRCSECGTAIVPKPRSGDRFIARSTFLAYPLTSLAWWYFRRRRRIRRAKLGLCAQCGYDLRGAASGRCSECGTAIVPGHPQLNPC